MFFAASDLLSAHRCRKGKPAVEQHKNMENIDRKNHWEKIYRTRELNEVSWYQPKPETSLEFLKEFNIPTTAKVIDIGGGDSFLVDHLLDLGYENVSVLDISETAIERAKKRLGDKAKNVKWIVSDAAAFKPTKKNMTFGMTGLPFIS